MIQVYCLNCSIEVKKVRWIDKKKVGKEIGDDIKVVLLSECNSTQDEVFKLLKTGEDRVICVASKIQRYGRGRFGREWLSPSGGLWFSIGIIKKMKLETADTLVKPITKKVYDVIKTLIKKDIITYIKEPNDIYIDGKKACGILLETQSDSKYIKRLVIGIGMNYYNIIRKTGGCVPNFEYSRLCDYTDADITNIFINILKKIKKFFDTEL
ncbi:MAG: biotin--[acetyl-CoA-carboxylase] ligase [Candidatus Hydrogenedentota bacterium]